MTDQTHTPYQLIGTESSLFTGKVRGYMRYKNIPFMETISSLSVYQKVITPRVGKRIIPLLITPDDQCIQDTTCIIDHLEQHFPSKSVYPDTPKQKLASLLLECFGDEWLVMPAMHYRWRFKRYNLPFILKEFGQTAMPNLPGFTHYFIGMIPAMAFGNLYRPYFGLDNKAIEKSIEISYEALLDDLNKHFEQYPYLLGDRPSIGDYGFLGPFYAHFYRDPYPGKMLKKRAPFVAKWVRRMEFLEDARYGDFLPNDEIPETLMPILSRMAKEQFPVLEDTASQLDSWCKKNSHTKNIKRVIGQHSFSIEGATSKRSITPFSYWMFQRALHVYNEETEHRKTLDTFLQEIGGTQAFSKQANTQLAYENYRLVSTSN